MSNPPKFRAYTDMVVGSYGEIIDAAFNADTTADDYLVADMSGNNPHVLRAVAAVCRANADRARAAGDADSLHYFDTARSALNLIVHEFFL